MNYVQNTFEESNVTKTQNTNRAPKFYFREFYGFQIAFVVWSTLVLLGSIVLLLFLLSIFLPNFDKGFLNLGIDQNYWPILIVVIPFYLLLLAVWISNVMTYSGFVKEFKQFKNAFPVQPTNNIKKRFISIHGKINSLAWLAAAIYITLILSLIVIYFYVFAINSWNQGGAQTIDKTAQLIIYQVDSDGTVYESSSLRFYVIVVGIIASIFFVCHIYFRLNFKIRLNRIENFYNGADKVVDPQYLAVALKKINRRNLILFSIYTLFLILLLYLIIKLPKKVLPKSNFFSKIMKR